MHKHGTQRRKEILGVTIHTHALNKHSGARTKVSCCAHTTTHLRMHTQSTHVVLGSALKIVKLRSLNCTPEDA